MSAVTATEWGIGVPGALGADAIRALAGSAEQLGYRSFWFNCVAPHADPAALLEAALDDTERIDIGIGVIPLDGYAAPELAASLASRGADDARVIVGVGSGSTRIGAVQRVRNSIDELRRALPHARVAVGGKRPRMLALGAELTDGLLFSMVTPDDARAIAARTDTTRRGRVASYNYHRVAIDPGGGDRVRTEMIGHGVTPRNPTDLLGTVLPEGREGRAVLDADLAAYPNDWLPVFRPLPARPDELGHWRNVFATLAPTGH